MNRAKPTPGDLELIGTGPINGAWRGPYLRCPTCDELVEKSGYNACRCGAITIDGDACRVIVRGVAETAIGQYTLKGVTLGCRWIRLHTRNWRPLSVDLISFE